MLVYGLYSIVTRQSHSSFFKVYLHQTRPLSITVIGFYVLMEIQSVQTVWYLQSWKFSCNTVMTDAFRVTKMHVFQVFH